MSTIAVNVLVAFVALVAATIYYGKTEFALQKIHEIVERKPGCNPIPSVGNVTLHYFAGRGRGEVIRLLMTTAGIPWTETKFNKDTWPAAKAAGVKSGLYTYGQGNRTLYFTITNFQYVNKLSVCQNNVAAFSCCCKVLQTGLHYLQFIYIIVIQSC